MQYQMNVEYEVIAKHCPACESLVMAQVVKTLDGGFYKYRDVKCPKCEWHSPEHQ
ncbi:MAG TPA: hypothetical protein PKG59_13945 [Spirochaetota bacterium]|mgnify:CR=1 FL=1|nr:hypothetical protein [Spirochaetota bacterium]HOS41239.1 hypothetical protein [Spirochaetota bacterium]